MMSGAAKHTDKDGVCFTWQEDVCLEIYGRILCSLGEGSISKSPSEVKIASCLVKTAICSMASEVGRLRLTPGRLLGLISVSKMAALQLIVSWVFLSFSIISACSDLKEIVINSPFQAGFCAQSRETTKTKPPCSYNFHYQVGK